MLVAHKPPAAAFTIDGIEELLNNRVRMMLQHKWLLGLCALLLLAGFAAVAIYFTAQASILKIAVGPAGSEDVKAIQTLADNLAHERTLMRLSLVITDGPQASGGAVDQGETDLAVVRSDHGLSQNAPAVAVLRRNALVLIVPPASARDPKKGKAPKIEKISDLPGRRIGIAAPSEASPELLHVVLHHYGIAPDSVKVSTIAVDQIRTAVHDNLLDVIMVAGPATGRAVAATVAAAGSKKDAATFIEIDHADAIEKRTAGYESIEVPAGSFGGSPPRPAESVTTLGFTHYLVARKSLSDARVAALAKVLYDARQTLANQSAGIVKIEAPSTDKDAAVILHPGAIAYLGDTQKSFFDRYGDQIFYGLLILPFFGSAIAGMASYFRADDRMRRLRVLHHLLELITRARHAETMATLDHLQAEADKILKITLHQVETNRLDDDALRAFSLVLEQARFAIADQRAILLGSPPKPEPLALADAGE
jgi:TRAP transporter TAXI family solute receptor